MSDKRTPYDGEPFYCVSCGAGYDEYGACDELDCKLETKAEAEARQRLHDPEKEGE